MDDGVNNRYIQQVTLHLWTCARDLQRSRSRHSEKKAIIDSLKVFECFWIFVNADGRLLLARVLAIGVLVILYLVLSSLAHSF